ncbi:MAG: metal ABC transporter substrate-binding protein [bacterium]|uniref:Periplasmic solute binding protein n=2 Tax=Bacteria candidate phyla TaxID=1783234 RepID=A0A101I2R4_UNCT6|nr:MAG: Periplasmic solute binding protein [candidate division TA06 bacterium 32_111]KUK87678.1 MAG: Periplasmic solute binding protein [candidate division TA06 bacterium 34_109]MDI6699812.1 metal ABC transporter substrate-binding protein [bacterium]HAF07517.1 hypothetical protein [candidate division WOR-3 bacterium]HCP17586.1 hypothetical protein [candidate division WOR-3 bacterium]
MKNKILILSILFFILLNFYSCKDTNGNKKVSVVSTIYPVKAFLESILDTSIQNSSVLDKNIDPHIAEITPSSFKKISQSKIFISLGSGIEFEEKNKNQFLIEAKNSIKIDLAKTLEEIEDPHIWISLKNLKIFSKILYDTLSNYNILDKTTLDQRIDILNRKINALEDSIKRMIKEKGIRKIFTDHNAFFYFGKEFNLELRTISDNEDEVSVKDLKNVQDEISKEMVKIFFYTNPSSENYAKNFESEIKVKSLYINPLEDPVKNFEKILTFFKNL